jgi:hypothetical protein
MFDPSPPLRFFPYLHTQIINKATLATHSDMYAPLIYIPTPTSHLSFPSPMYPKKKIYKDLAHSTARRYQR